MVDLSKYKDLFISEAEDHLQKLNEGLLILEKIIGEDIEEDHRQKILDELMRHAHSIKGSSKMMGYNHMAYFTHILEDVFDWARTKQLDITSEIIDAIFYGLDELDHSLSGIKKDNKELDLSKLAQRIKKITGVKTAGIGKSERVIQNNNNVKKEKKNDLKNKEARILKGKNNNMLQNDEEEAAKNNVEKMETISFVKVPVSRLDKLMDLMEELLIDKMKLEQIIKIKIQSKKKNDEQHLEKEEKLENTVNHLSRLVSDIQYQVMQARLVPIDQIFVRFPRMVRDLAKLQNKEIEFKLDSGNLELDRTIIDKLSEPLIHLLRNAIDHGIKEQGIIKIEARREREYAIISVENSDQCIDIEAVRKAAVEKGIVTSEIAGVMDNDQVIELLFNPRLSTKKKVTQTSGRGVGLSVVKEFVSQMGGRISIESSLEKGGTRFILELPLTLAILNSLLIQSAGKQFALPFSNVLRSVNVSKANIKSMADQDVAIVDGEDIPLVRLNKIFDLVENNEIKNMTGTDFLCEKIVIVKTGNEFAGIVVDELIDEQEIIVKPLPSILRDTRGFSGSTILGDGNTILILDINSMLENTKKLVRTNNN